MARRDRTPRWTTRSNGLEIVADTFLSVSTPAQLALPELLRRGAAVRAQIAARIRRNLDALRAAVRGLPRN